MKFNSKYMRIASKRGEYWTRGSFGSDLFQKLVTAYMLQSPRKTSLQTPSFSTFLSPPCNLLLPTIQREGREKIQQAEQPEKLTILPRSRLAPYERRVIELLRNSKDKRARKLAKKRVRPLSFLFVPVHCIRSRLHIGDGDLGVLADAGNL